MQTETNSGQILKIGDVAKEWQCCERTVIRRIKEGVLPAIRFGGQWRVRRSDLEAALAGRRLASREEVLG